MSSQWYLKFQPSPSMIHSSFLFFHIYSFTHSENLSPIIYNIFTYLLNIPVRNQYLLRSLLTSLWLWHAWVLNHVLSIPPQGPCSSCLGFSTQCPLHLSFFSQKDTFFTLLSSDTTLGFFYPPYSAWAQTPQVRLIPNIDVSPPCFEPVCCLRPLLCVTVPAQMPYYDFRTELFRKGKRRGRPTFMIVPSFSSYLKKNNPNNVLIHFF